MDKKDELALKTLREEALSKVGYIGRLFGSGEAAKTNYVGCTLILLVCAAGAALYTNANEAFHIISPLIGAVLGYFVKR